MLSIAVERWLSAGKISDIDRDLILQRLNVIKNTYNFKDVIFHDLQQSRLLATNGESSPSHIYDNEQTLKPHKIIIGDMHTHVKLNDTDKEIFEFHVIIPISIDKEDNDSLLGSLMIVIDPYEQLFPMVKSWPLNSKSGESLLAMKTGSGIMFPHKLRFSNDQQSGMKIPVDTNSLLVTQAFRNHGVVIEGRDYRDANVIAISTETVRPNWVLITKIDLHEIYIALASRLIQIALPTIVLLLLLIGIIYSSRKKLNLSNQMQKEKAKTRLQALNKHYSYLTKYANDIILLSDDKGVILEANDRALESYQYIEEELIGKNIMDLENQKQDGAAREKLFSISNDGMVFETLHRRNDSTTFPVEINYRSILIRDRVFRQLIIRDITERRKSLSDLKRIERRFQLAVEASHTGLWDWNILNDSIWWSTEQYSLLGYKNREVEPGNLTLADILHPKDRTQFKLKLSAHLKRGEIFKMESRLRMKSGEYRWFKVKGSVIKDRQGINIRMLGSLSDITERVQDQQNSLITNRALKTLSAGNEAVVYSQTEEELLQNISNVMVGEGGYMLSRIYYLDMENTTPFQLVMKASSKEIELKTFDDKNFIRFLEKHNYTSEVINKGKNVVIQDILNDPEFVELRTLAFLDGYVAMMILPLINHNKVFGLLVIFSPTAFAFNKREAALLDELANVLAHGINSLRMKSYQIKTQNALLQSELRNRVAIEGTQQGIWELDFANNQIVLDKTWMEIMGYETNRYTYDREWLDDHITSESLKELKNSLQEYLSGKTDFFAANYEFKNKDGENKWASTRGVILERDEQGKPAKMVGSHWEITEIKNLRDHHKRSVQIMEATLIETIKAISLTTEKRDPYTAGHQNRVSLLATAIARVMELGEDRIKGVELGAIIHDIGKIYIPSEILNRPGRISEPEFQLIKSHPDVGYDIVKGINFPWPVAEMIYQHHERLDGSGYPQGLVGDEIILEAQIIAVADVIEAISSHRPYRPALGIEAGIKIIEENKGIHFNPEIVDICIKLLREENFVFEQNVAA